MMSWVVERDLNLAKREQAMAEARAVMMESAVKTNRTFDRERATSAQMELFAVAPHQFDYVEKLLSALPRKRQREHFRHVWLRAFNGVKDDGSIAFRFGNKQAAYANHYLREILTKRLKAVFQHYQISLDWLAERDVHSRAIALSKGKQTSTLPFYLLRESQLKDLAFKLANIFARLQSDFLDEQAERKAKGEISIDDFGELARDMYRLCGEVCADIGFPLKNWKAFLEKAYLDPAKIDTDLQKSICERYWKRQLETAQKRLKEHVEIGCGAVSAKVSPYVSQNALREYREKRAENMDYLEQMMLENLDDESEQMPLIEMWKRTVSNPAIQFNEMMNCLRGIDEWGTEYNYASVFFTMTAPSSFHATHNNGTNNKKWKGASPRDTQRYLNKVWAQLRAQFAKRDIGFFGYRGVEPHHDGTPHWHMLVYVKPEQKDEMITLFKKKALELDGDEFGAKKHRCKVDEIDPEKGSAIGYIAKYIAKNIYAGKQANEKSDEVEDLTLRENVLRVKAWASLWGIRQFQFYGTPPISVWRELRKIDNAMAATADDDTLDTGRAVADVGCFGSYLDVQGGAMVKRCDQPICIEYQETEPNKYGETRNKIVGVKNRFNLKTIITKVKNWVIKRGSVGSTSADSETTETNKARSAAWTWTCVSNCNRSKIEQQVNQLMLPIGFPLKPRQIDMLIKYGRLRLNDYRWICCENDNVYLEEVKIPLAQAFGWGESLGDFRRK
ncbi:MULTISPECIES: replication endonuclease [Rodentibacter]|uniref:replication endonuclease n=1 Tax=Rodentibacter TaxID=1960084 RepID=UPI001CFD1611|nr:replication endonuclease [Rodentibacter sp. JRC1]GJI55872.1 replication protein A [Rodentibacter sp. JRC1]